jgi:D-glycero-alpha-D-manno-heptose-7-phosphate kinase
VASEGETLSGLRMQKELASSMKEALLRGRLSEFGELLGAVWESKKRLSPRITTPTIDEAYAAALEAGALGGKVVGAGGGGFMIFYCRPRHRHRVEERLGVLGLKPTEFAFDHEGLRTWTYVES